MPGSKATSKVYMSFMAIGFLTKPANYCMLLDPHIKNNRRTLP